MVNIDGSTKRVPGDECLALGQSLIGMWERCGVLRTDICVHVVVMHIKTVLPSMCGSFSSLLPFLSPPSYLPFSSLLPSFLLPPTFLLPFPFLPSLLPFLSTPSYLPPPLLPLFSHTAHCSQSFSIPFGPRQTQFSQRSSTS